MLDDNHNNDELNMKDNYKVHVEYSAQVQYDLEESFIFLLVMIRNVWVQVVGISLIWSWI